MIIPLGDALLRRSSNLPAGFGSRERVSAPGRTGPIRHRCLQRSSDIPAYLVLLRVGFTMPRLLPGARCALTAPFHPYRWLSPEAVCSLLHWPSRWLEPSVPDVIRHTALRSSDFPLPLFRAAAIIRPPAAFSVSCVDGRLDKKGPSMPCIMPGQSEGNLGLNGEGMPSNRRWH